MGGDRRLSARARGILENAANQRVVSIVSLWEIAIKISLGKLPSYGLTVIRIWEEVKRQRFALIPVRLEDLVRMEKLPWIHRDPFDRLLIAQAQEDNVPLLTSDAQILQYPVETIW
jgi:PIN domain nuclease of toxin-antitoxin system